MKVFVSVLDNSRKIRFSYNLYRIAPAGFKAVLIVLYGLKCYLSLAWARDGAHQLVFFASYPNERRVLNHVRNNLCSIEQGEVTISLRNCVRLTSLTDVVMFVPVAVRLYRYAGKLVSRYDFMPACRIFSALTYYMRFKRLLAGSAAKAVFIACQYSPECLGFAAAAHQSDKKVLFANHANATGETGNVAPIYADLIAVTSQALADIYRRHTPKKLNIVPITIAVPQKPMQVPGRDAGALAVGIYLTALTDRERLQQVVSALSQLPSIGTVFIRTHPAQVVNVDLSRITGRDGPVEISNARPLHEDIERTDIAFCGNSTVTIEILRGGRPVLYDHRLDRLAYDYNGYAGHNLVLACPQTLHEGFLDLIGRHYLDMEWPDRMRYFDSSYQMDETAIMRRFRAAVIGILHEA